MENNPKKDGPLTATFIFDNKNDELFFLTATKTPEFGLNEALPVIMEISATYAKIPDARIVAYEIPDLNQLPVPNHQNCERYYRDL